LTLSFLFIRKVGDGSTKVPQFVGKVVLRPAQVEERMELLLAILSGFQEVVQSGCTFQPDQKETLFKAPDLFGKNLKHLLGLAKGNSVYASLHDEEGEENILRSWDAEIIAQQLESSHEGVRIGMDLRRGQLGPAKHILLEIGEWKLETHIFENHLIHGKDMVLVLQTHPIRRAWRNQLPKSSIAYSPTRNLAHAINSEDRLCF
jgi:hypothetical protein